jgi:hypothetical protein
MKHINIIVLIALLTLIAGCSVFNEPLTPHNTDNLAQVRVNIGSSARTLLPDFDGVFSKYILSAEPAGDNEQNAPSLVERNVNDNLTIGVPYGEWIITVTAYVKLGGTDYAVVKGSGYADVWGDTRVYITLNLPVSEGTGTFTYAVTYPDSASAQVKLEPWPLEGGTALIDTSVTSGVTASQSVASGIYFLTVKATGSERTVTRNEIVHIYRGHITNANYVFTKLDFGDGLLKIEGTVNVLLNGEQPDYAYVSISGSDYWEKQDLIYFTGTNGDGTWSADLDNFYGADTLYFWVNALGFFRKEVLYSIPVPVKDITGINLGTVSINTTTLTENNWLIAQIPAGEYQAEDWYSVEVVADETYYFWLNNSNEGDGDHKAFAYMEARSSDGNYSFYNIEDAWYVPQSFTASTNGKIYLKVRSYNWGTGTSYAIAYSTNGDRPD